MDEENRNEATTNNSPIAIAPDQMHQLTEEEEKKFKPRYHLISNYNNHKTQQIQDIEHCV